MTKAHMLIYGKRTVRVKRYTDNHRQCPECRAFDLGVMVYKEYFHLFFVPAFPTGKKYAEIRCRSCGHPVRTESLHKEYLDKTRTPFYLYTLIILFAGVFVLALAGNLITQRQKKKYIADPHPGDIYTIRKDIGGTALYFQQRVTRINGDTVFVNPQGVLVIDNIPQTDSSDSFSNREIKYTKKQLQEMLGRGDINAVKRK